MFYLDLENEEIINRDEKAEENKKEDGDNDVA